MKIGYLTKRRDACFWLRILNPMSILNSIGHEAEDELLEQQLSCSGCKSGRQERQYFEDVKKFDCPSCGMELFSEADLSEWRKSIDKIIHESDIVVFQRPTHPDHLRLIDKAKSLGKKTVQTADDDYFNVPEWNAGHRYYLERKDIVSKSFEMVDGVDVTTPALQRLYSSLNKNVQILPNCLDVSFADVTPASQPRVFDASGKLVMWDDFKSRTAGKKIVLWSGGPTHLMDLEIVVNPIRRASRSFDDIVFAFFGYIHRGILSACARDKLFLFSMTTNADYYGVYKAIDPHVVLAPLVQNEFNRGKSNLRALEAQMFNALPVMTNFDTYAGSSPRGIYVENSDYDWFRGIRLAAGCDDYQDRVSENRKFIEDNFDISKKIGLWEEFYQGVLNK